MNISCTDEDLILAMVGSAADKADGEIFANGGPEKWNAIRRVYARNMKHIEARPSGIDPYLIDWTKVMTPIELKAWGCIRGIGIPFYPQFPVGRVFIDFADPLKKIGLELDGAAYHDKGRDRVRDESLARLGWKIYRVPGFEANDCMTIDHEELLDADACGAMARIEHVFFGTCEGVVRAIALEHYGKGKREFRYMDGALDAGNYASATLRAHCLV